MRSFILIVSLMLFLLGVAPDAHAHEDKGIKANPCMKEKMMSRHKMKKEFMNEGMGILLDTIVLLKDSATDPKMKTRAAALENRMRTHLQKHDQMHEKMKGMHKMGGNPCNPCSKGGHKDDDDHKHK